jgi:hypothetical protein
MLEMQKEPITNEVSLVKKALQFRNSTSRMQCHVLGEAATELECCKWAQDRKVRDVSEIVRPVFFETRMFF